MGGHAAGVGDAQAGAAGQALELAGVEGSIGGEEDDAGAGVGIGLRRRIGCHGYGFRVAQPQAGGLAQYRQLLPPPEVGQHQDAQGIPLGPARGGADAGLETEGPQAGAGAHRSLGYGAGGRRRQGGAHLGLAHGPALTVAEPAVVALQDDRVDGDQIRVLLDAPGDQGVGHPEGAEGAREQHGRLQHAQLGHLGEPGALHEAVEDEGGGGHLLPHQVAPVGQHGGDAGAPGAAPFRQGPGVGPDGAVPDKDARHVGDGVGGAHRQGAHRQAQFPGRGSAHRVHLRNGFLLAAGQDAQGDHGHGRHVVDGVGENRRPQIAGVAVKMAEDQAGHSGGNGVGPHLAPPATVGEAEEGGGQSDADQRLQGAAEKYLLTDGGQGTDEQHRPPAEAVDGLRRRAHAALGQGFGKAWAQGVERQHQGHGCQPTDEAVAQGRPARQCQQHLPEQFPAGHIGDAGGQDNHGRRRRHRYQSDEGVPAQQ